MILESVENGPLIWPTIEENGVIRPKKYSELTPADAIQANCDVKATNIILQGLPTEVYALVSHHKVTKDLWERIQLLIKFVTDVKLVRDLHTTNIDQLHAYLGQHEFHANDIRLMHELNQQPEFPQPDSGLIVLVFKQGDDPIDAINHMMSFLSAVVTSRYPTTNNQLRNLSNPRQQATINDGRVILQPVQGRQIFVAAGTTRTNTPAASGSNSGKQRNVICYNCKREGHMSKQCTKPKRKRDDSWFKDKVLLAMPSSEQSSAVNHSETEITSDSNIIPYSQYVKESQQAAINLDNKSVNDTLTAELERYKEQVKVLKEGQNVDLKIRDNVLESREQSKEESRNIDREIALEKKIKQLDNIVYKRDQSAQTVHMLTKPQFFYDHTTKKALGFQNPFYLKKGQQLEPNLYDGNVIKNTSAIVIPNSEETLMLAEESHSKMLLKQQDPMVLEKKVNTTPVNYAALNQLS
ncbi:retrovirus-related pol polyprotein from transposon TNT 1-94 [Tanacetum coccineum]